jgi:hypothetical protein
MNTYTMVYPKNAVTKRFVNHPAIAPAKIAPIKCPRIFMKVRFTMDAPTVTEVIMRGIALLNWDRPNA